jgi:hypothetical protein
MSSLEQLVKLGVLDPDFLKLDSEPGSDSDLGLDSEPGSDLGLEQQRGSGYERRRGYHGTSDRRSLDHVSSEPMVEYITRASPAPSVSSAQVPNDLEYYQNVRYHWLYSSPSYGWWHFAKDDNEQLEQMYRNGQRQGTIQIGYNSFTVDFEHMMQKGAGKPRHILRSPTLGDILLKGVAGSRISKRDILADSVDQSHFGTAVATSDDLESESTIEDSE